MSGQAFFALFDTVVFAGVLLFVAAIIINYATGKGD